MCFPCQPGRVDPAEHLTSFTDPHDYDAYQPRCYPQMPHSSAQKITVLERIRAGAALDLRDASDSDEEMEERRFQAGDLIDVLDTSKKWLPAHVIAVSDDQRSLHIHFDNWSRKFDEHIPTDSSRITRFGRFSTGQIGEVRERHSAAAAAAAAATAQASKEYTRWLPAHALVLTCSLALLSFALLFSIPPCLQRTTQPSRHRLRIDSTTDAQNCLRPSQHRTALLLRLRGTSCHCLAFASALPLFTFDCFRCFRWRARV